MGQAKHCPIELGEFRETINKERRGNMKKFYYVNNDQTRNPGLHHEVHTEEHANELNITNKSYLGYYDSCFEAVEKAKEKI